MSNTKVPAFVFCLSFAEAPQLLFDFSNTELASVCTISFTQKMDHGSMFEVSIFCLPGDTFDMVYEIIINGNFGRNWNHRRVKGYAQKVV